MNIELPNIKVEPIENYLTSVVLIKATKRTSNADLFK